MMHDGENKIATIGDLSDRLCAMFPAKHAEKWDRTGLLAGDRTRHVTKVAIALDPTREAVSEAAAQGANCLVTHHPAFLSVPDSFTPDMTASGVGAVVYDAIRADVSLINYHTALDVSAEAYEMLPRKLGLMPYDILEPIGPSTKDGQEVLGYGQMCRIAQPSETITLDDLAILCESTFHRTPRVWGSADSAVQSVCTWTGSVGDSWKTCIDKRIDALICGEIKYHAALEASSCGLGIIELGHDVSELPFVALLAHAVASCGIPDSNIIQLNQESNWHHPNSRRVK